MSQEKGYIRNQYNRIYTEREPELSQLSMIAQMLYSHAHAYVIDDGLGTLIKVPEGSTAAKAIGSLMGFSGDEKKLLPKAIRELIRAGAFIQDGASLAMNPKWVSKNDKRQGKVRKRSPKGLGESTASSSETLIRESEIPSLSPSLSPSTCTKDERPEGFDEIWASWTSTFGHGDMAPTEADMALIRDRLAEGLGIQNLLDAIAGTARSEFWSQHQSFESIFKDRKSVIDRGAAPKPKKAADRFEDIPF